MKAVEGRGETPAALQWKDDHKEEEGLFSIRSTDRQQSVLMWHLLLRTGVLIPPLAVRRTPGLTMVAWVSWVVLAVDGCGMVAVVVDVSRRHDVWGAHC
ncbi:hypothetical protein L484_020013 [Morus notabilis]|uniref:Uncharacterized protein n=1 Tax=Morus notabilis TaxID=981085 RepID=W9SM02_9ROSA|nr:hypothetical protein L484_020013 [Morus notabilis]